MTIESIKAAYLEGKADYLGDIPYDADTAAQSVHSILAALNFDAVVVWHLPSRSFHVYAKDMSVAQECQVGHKVWTEKALFEREVERLKCSVRAHVRQHKYSKEGLVVDFVPDPKVAARFTTEVVLGTIGICEEVRVSSTCINGQLRICFTCD